MRTSHAIGLLAALTLMACSEMGVGPRQGGTQETLTHASATVEAIDQSTREVRLRDNADGSSFAVTAGPEVRKGSASRALTFPARGHFRCMGCA